MSTHLCLKYKYQRDLKQIERTVLEQLFLDIPSGTKPERALYTSIVEQFLEDNDLLSLMDFAHHKHTTRLMHCMHVSYLCFLQAYRHQWDYHSAAIGGLLHDFCLCGKKDYIRKDYKDIWCFYHPRQALIMAESKYELNDTMRDIIRTHMFPMALSIPKYRETWLIAYWDKYCAVRERLAI